MTIVWWLKYIRSAHQTIHTILFLLLPSMVLLRPNQDPLLLLWVGDHYQSSFCTDLKHLVSNQNHVLQLYIFLTSLRVCSKAGTSVWFFFLPAHYRSKC